MFVTTHMYTHTERSLGENLNSKD